MSTGAVLKLGTGGKVRDGSRTVYRARRLVSRTTIESWLQAGVLIPASSAKRRRHEVTIESLIRLQVLLEELRRLGKSRELREYVWWSAQDATDYAEGKLAQALRQLRRGELGDEYMPSAEDLNWARRQFRNGAAEEES